PCSSTTLFRSDPAPIILGQLSEKGIRWDAGIVDENFDRAKCCFGSVKCLFDSFWFRYVQGNSYCLTPIGPNFLYQRLEAIKAPCGGHDARSGAGKHVSEVSTEAGRGAGH